VNGKAAADENFDDAAHSDDAAHPDDAEFQAGATLAKWAAAGCRVTHLVLTDGSKGTWDPDQDPAALVAARHDEQRAAATVLGAEDPIFVDLIDGELVSGIVERGRVAEVIRRVRPDVVLGHDPWTRYRLHPDHHAAGRLCVEGVVAARDPGFHREQVAAEVRSPPPRIERIDRLGAEQRFQHSDFVLLRWGRGRAGLQPDGTLQSGT